MQLTTCLDNVFSSLFSVCPLGGKHASRGANIELWDNYAIFPLTFSENNIPLWHVD